MPEKKRIVLCSDGTGNIVVKNRGTNVWKTFEAVDVNGHRDASGPGDRTTQVAFYDDGLGTENAKIVKILGGAFGWGLGRNVRELYTMLCRVYEPGDDIFLFGFSRGAHTVRTLAGLICRCGVVCDRDDEEGRLTNAELEVLVDDAYRQFRKHFRLSAEDVRQKSRKCQDAERATEAFRAKYGHAHDEFAPGGRVPIRFIGVWDSVSALGLPFKPVKKFWNRFIYSLEFPTTALSDLVAKGCHAVAIDDERETFHPNLWDEAGESDDQRIEQVWFAGVHSNVGGGYPKQGMSLVTLDWIMTKAEEAGLRFLPQQRALFRELKNIHDKKYDSRTGPKVFYRYKPREIGAICAAANTQPKLHSSVLERIGYATENYAPGNLSARFEIVPEPTDPPERIEPLRLMFSGTSDDAGEPTPTASMIGQHFPELRRWTSVRRWLHICFLLAFVALTVTAGIFAFRMLFGVGTADAGIVWIPFAAWGLGFLGLLAIAYGIGTVARKKQLYIFSNFWNRAIGLSWFGD